MLLLFFAAFLSFLQQLGGVPLQDFYQTVDLLSETISVHCIRSNASPNNKKVDVLLLHGAKFSAKTWERYGLKSLFVDIKLFKLFKCFVYSILISIGTLEKLSDSGFTAIAIDLPGSGSTESLKNDHQPHIILERIIKSLGLSRPVIISPSKSGLYSLDYLLRNPDGVAAFIPIAPVFPENFTNFSSELPTSDIAKALALVPAFVVWGSLDTPGKRRSKVLLNVFPKALPFEIENGSHPCYLDQPDMFNRAVTAFLASRPSATKL